MNEVGAEVGGDAGTKSGTSTTLAMGFFFFFLVGGRTEEEEGWPRSPRAFLRVPFCLFSSL